MGIAIITVIDDGSAAAAAAAPASDPLSSTSTTSNNTSSTSSTSSSQQPRQQRCEHRCEIARLIHHVPRLRAACVNVPPGQDCRITVHADVSTFSWLMAWVKAQHTDGLDAAAVPPPVLEPSNVVPLLLASGFLRMRPLDRACVAFTAAHLAAAPTHQLLALPAGLLAKVAGAASEEALEALVAHAASEQQHPHGLLAELLFKHKLRVMLQQHATTLERCQACGSVFSTAARTQLVCSCSTSTAGRQANAGHTSDPSWDLVAFLQQHRSGQHPHSWRELFWMVWSAVTVLRCETCGVHFPAREQDGCRFHPQAAVFTSESTPGCHPCCGAPAWRPGMPRNMRADGCCCRLHEPARASAPDSVLQLLRRFSSLIRRPWPHPHVDDKGASAAHTLPHQQQQQQTEESEGLAAGVPLLVVLVSRQPEDHAARHSCQMHAGVAEASSADGRSSSSSDDQADSSVCDDDDDNGASSDTCSSTTGDSDAAASSNTCACGAGLPVVCSRLGRLVAQVRTTAAARSRHTGLGANVAAAAASGDASVAAADAHTRMGVALPLAETFSAGGRRVLQAARRHQQQEASGGAQQQGGAAGSDSAGAAPTMTRSRLLQLLLDEDRARMTSLMQHLDLLRGQPLPTVDAASRPRSFQAAACSHRLAQRTASGGICGSMARSGQAQTADSKKKQKKMRGVWLPV